MGCLVASSQLVGCSGASGSGGMGGGAGGGGAMVTVDQACTDYAAAICGKINSCYPFLVTLTYTDVTQCQTRQKLSCTAAAGANGSAATATALEACTSAFGGLTCLDLQTNSYPTACQLNGTLANGTACGADSQCQSGSCNLNGQPCGVCAVRISAGGACTAAPGSCDHGLTCSGGTCKARVAAGGSCAGGAPCAAGSYCSNSSTCTATTSAGGSCSQGAGACSLLDGLYCSGSMVCANIDTAAAGDPCGAVSGGYTACKGSGACKVSGATGTCAAPIADGATCGQNDSCIPPASCTNGTCKLPNPGSCM